MHSLPLPLVMIGRRHIRRAKSRAVVQIRQRTMTMNQLKTFPLLSTHAFSLFHVIVLVLFFFPGTRPFDMPAHYTGTIGAVSDVPLPYPSVSFLDTSAVPFKFMANFDPHSISSGEVASQLCESVIPSHIVYDSPLRRCTIHDVLILILSSDTRPMVVPSSSDPAVSQSGYPPYAQGFASKSRPTAHPHISPQRMSDLDAHITSRIRTVHAHGDTLSLNIPVPVFRHPSKSPLSTPDIASRTSRPGDCEQSLDQR